jgi:ubiquitin C-terminal hydrolase
MQNMQNFQNMQNGQNLQNIQNLQNMQNCNMNMFYPQMNMNMNINMSNNFPQQNNANNNTNNNANNFINNITSLKQLSYCPKIGLVNLGQTCYMNSVLQCFSNLYHITNYFLNPKRQQKIEEHMTFSNIDKDSLLCFVYKDLLDNLWKGTPNQPFSPIKFKKRLEKLNPLFAENTAGDSKDFANYLIMELHNELNNIESNPNINANYQNLADINVNPFDQNQVFNAFMGNFALTQYSIISCYFYGVTQGQFECQGCKNKLLSKGIQKSPIKYNYENFFYLEFPLDEVRKHMANLNNMSAYYQTINQVSLLDCFNYHQKVNTMMGYCEKCKIDNAQINSQNFIYSPSSILMIIFNRGQGLQYKIKVNFPQQLDITNIVINHGNQHYDLRGVVKHFGESGSSGHFIAYSRSAVPSYNNQWYCFNDDTVVEVYDFNEIVEKGDTYILFYELNGP